MRHIREDIYAAMGTGFTTVPAISEHEIKSLSKCLHGKAMLAVLSARRGGQQLVFHEVLKILGMDHKGIYAHTFKAALAYTRLTLDVNNSVRTEAHVEQFALPSDTPTIVSQIKRRLEWEEKRKKTQLWKPEDLAGFGVATLNRNKSRLVQRRHHANGAHRTRP